MTAFRVLRAWWCGAGDLDRVLVNPHGSQEIAAIKEQCETEQSATSKRPINCKKTVAVGLPTEPVGSLPRPATLQAAIKGFDEGIVTRAQLTAEQDAACRGSITRMEATGSPIVSDGEQRASSFATYPLTDTLAGTGLADHLAGDGQYFASFTDGHHRQLPRRTGGPFRYKTFAADYLAKAMPKAHKPLKQAVIAPSMLALLFPLDDEVAGYPREQFLAALCDECEKDIRKCFAAGAVRVPIDFTEGRLACRNDLKTHGPGAACWNISSS